MRKNFPEQNVDFQAIDFDYAVNGQKEAEKHAISSADLWQ
jgi:hypothetical protein